MAFIVLGAVVGSFLLIAALMDRRARHRGHRLRGTKGAMALRETLRDQRAQDVTLFLNQDTRWTAAGRRNADANAQQRREDNH
ncbi:MAG: hypothetical protein QOJ83_518 [Frankiales bacterium]|jgi:F0F1-type ATP synthase beta subunit|nr:hypothetical protein [Frankiales bacterium]MDX6222449.1 hypothetical protein [Frankiales bacterium]